MLYLAMRISMESGIRIGSLKKMRWSHISHNKTLSAEDQKVWCLIEVPAENTKTGRWYELSAPVVAHLDQMKKIAQPKSKSDLLFTNRKTGKPFSDRLWRDGLFEAMVEAGLARWSEGDSNNLRKIDIHSGKTLSWYSFRHTFITEGSGRGGARCVFCVRGKGHRPRPSESPRGVGRQPEGLAADGATEAAYVSRWPQVRS